MTKTPNEVLEMLLSVERDIAYESDIRRAATDRRQQIQLRITAEAERARAQAAHQRRNAGLARRLERELADAQRLLDKYPHDAYRAELARKLRGQIEAATQLPDEPQPLPSASKAAASALAWLREWGIA